ncbi:hypothetical protein [Pseudonocardia adelaidensis]|uniref:Uncharacterized protein n=1 Tax=Pseudonocardia adelaidensis TaxID=648754 RepID=A0ABP9NMR7_9PSEU
MDVAQPAQAAVDLRSTAPSGDDPLVGRVVGGADGHPRVTPDESPMADTFKPIHAKKMLTAFERGEPARQPIARNLLTPWPALPGTHR